MKFSNKWLLPLLMICVLSACGGDPAIVDTTAPTLASTNPVDTSTGVPFNRKITAIFSERMSAASCTTTTFTLRQGATAIAGSVSCVDGTAIFAPSAALTASTLYTATLTSGLTDLTGNAFAGGKTWTFTTGTAADSTAPTVVSTNPANTATGVSLNRNVTAVFSEAMDPATVTGTNFTLTQGANAVPGTVTSISSVATFDPTNDLSPSTLYTASITTTAADLAGNVLAVTKTWSFTTGTSNAAGPAPVLLGTAGNFVILSKSGISTVPTSVITGDIGVSPIDQTAITGFSEAMDGSGTFSTAPQVTGNIFAADYTAPTPAYLTTAVSDMEIAYTDAAGRSLPNFSELGAGEIGGLTLVPGLYKWGTGLSISTNVTLTGGPNDIWIFQVAGALTQANGTTVSLTGGAVATNVFWQTFGAANIGTTAHFEGILLSQTAINLGTNAVAIGRLFAQTAVTLNKATVRPTL